MTVPGTPVLLSIRMVVVDDTFIAPKDTRTLSSVGLM